MKSFRVLRNNQPTIIVELSWADVFKLLFGREIVLSNQMKILTRIPLPYAAFNLRAKVAE